MRYLFLLVTPVFLVTELGKMSDVGLILGIVGLLLAAVALWNVWRVQRELSARKREHYYLEQKVKAIPAQIEAAVEPLRIQVALLAQGRLVSDHLIRTGRLYHEISAENARGLLIDNSGSERILLLDVRSPGEYAKRHISRSTLIPVEDLEMRYRTEISPALEKIFVYCASGDRSRLACDFLSRRDYGNVYYIKDGLGGWTGPVEGTEVGGLIQIGSKGSRKNNFQEFAPRFGPD